MLSFLILKTIENVVVLASNVVVLVTRMVTKQNPLPQELLKPLPVGSYVTISGKSKAILSFF